MARWSIRNYNAFLRAARKKADLTQGQAKTVYRQMSGKLGRPLTGTDVKKHPIIFKRSERFATGAVTKVTVVSRGRASATIPGGGSSGETKRGGGTVGSLRQWESHISDYADYELFEFDFDEYESSANYGEAE